MKLLKNKRVRAWVEEGKVWCANQMCLGEKDCCHWNECKWYDVEIKEVE